MTPCPKNVHVPPKFFFAIFSKNVAFLEKIIEWKTIQNLISDKKCFIHFRRQTLALFLS